MRIYDSQLASGTTVETTMTNALSVSCVEGETVAFVIKNTHGSAGLSWQVVASNDPAFTDAHIIQVPATVAAAGVGVYAAGPAPYAYYKVMVKDAIDLTHATYRVRGHVKG